MATPTLSSRIQNRVEGKAIRNEIESDYTAPAVNTEARYVDEKGRKLVEMQENMRTAARFSEIEDTMNKNKIEKSMFESDKNSIGPVQPTPKTQDYSDLYTAAMKTVDFEARKDKDGNPIIYELPAGDMGLLGLTISTIQRRLKEYQPCQKSNARQQQQSIFKGILLHWCLNCHKPSNLSLKIWRLIVGLAEQPNTFSRGLISWDKR